MVGPGSQFILGPGGFTIPRGSDINPPNLRPGGLERASAHSGTTPKSASISCATRQEEPERRDNALPSCNTSKSTSAALNLAGASFSTQLLRASVAGEISYRDGVPVLVDVEGSPTATTSRVLQAQLSTIYTIGPSFLADSQTVIGEIAYQHVVGVDAVNGFSTLTNTEEFGGATGGLVCSLLQQRI
ncbi:DUF1302 family protein [Cupriavidus basilensis]